MGSGRKGQDTHVVGVHVRNRTAGNISVCPLLSTHERAAPILDARESADLSRTTAQRRRHAPKPRPGPAQIQGLTNGLIAYQRDVLMAIVATQIRGLHASN
jgi:hypothetical protein